MVALHSRRLERVFGTVLDDVAHAHIAELVTNGVVEDYDLDFKGSMYGRSDSEKRDLCGDVAAMANTAGGVIIVGVMEDKQARASEAPGVPISDAEINRIRQTVAGGVNPLPRFDVLPIYDPNQPDHGFVLIAVPRSVMYPHAVMVNDGLRYPRRNGATINYLSEAEVAEAYRARFAGIAGRIDEAAKIEAEFLPRLNTTAETFLVVTLVPDLPGNFTLDNAAFQQFQQEAIGRSPFIVSRALSWQRATVRRRRLSANANLDGLPIASRLGCELHESGAGVVASYLDRRQEAADNEPQVSEINDEVVVNALAGALTFLAHHARHRAATGGYATVRVTICPVAPRQRARLVHERGFRNELGRQQVDEPPVADGVFDIDALLDDSTALLAATYRLCSGVFQEFGVPEALQLTPSGKVRSSYWGHAWNQEIRRWAATNGVEIAE